MGQFWRASGEALRSGTIQGEDIVGGGRRDAESNVPILLKAGLNSGPTPLDG